MGVYKPKLNILNLIGTFVSNITNTNYKIIVTIVEVTQEEEEEKTYSINLRYNISLHHIWPKSLRLSWKNE